MGKKSGPPPPPAPDPRATASAQTASNVATAVANTRMQNADEVSPLGNVRYEVMGYETVSDGMGGTHQVPKYRRVSEYTPEQMGLLRQEQEADKLLNQLAIDQTKRINDTLSEPINLEGLPDAPGDMEAYRSSIEDAMLSRLNPQIDRERSALETQLVNQGLVRGSEAFNEALDEARRQSNDLRVQAHLASGSEAREQGAFQATNRERALQERLMTRNQPINEIGALLGTGQVSLPQFTPFRPSSMSETPYGQYVYQGYGQQLDAWKTQQQMRAQNNAGMFGLGSALIGGLFKLSDARLKRDIERIGTLPNGIGLYRYRYAWSDEIEIGVIAQDVLRKKPQAVVRVGPFLAVDYGKVL